METNWATEHLQVIRTLMERSAVYRRALAPVMVLTGVLGVVAAVVGWMAKVESPRGFTVYWLVVGAVVAAAAFVLVRKQALKEREPLWSPPTRRVTQALLPPLIAGFVLSVIALLKMDPQASGNSSEIVRLPALWIILYGCALHAAGFFMPRGMKLFGWAFVLGGCAIMAIGVAGDLGPPSVSAHGIMGLFFGVSHLGYGVYLYFTERQKTAL